MKKQMILAIMLIGVSATALAQDNFWGYVNSTGPQKQTTGTDSIAGSSYISPGTNNGNDSSAVGSNYVSPGGGNVTNITNNYYGADNNTENATFQKSGYYRRYPKNVYVRSSGYYYLKPTYRPCNTSCSKRKMVHNKTSGSRHYGPRRR